MQSAKCKVKDGYTDRLKMIEFRYTDVK